MNRYDYVMVTEPAGQTDRRCRWCGRRFPVVAGPGRPREFCGQPCRQRDYEARRGGRRLVEDGNVLVLPRQSVRDLQDRLWIVEAAVTDARIALDERASATAARRVLDELLQAVEDLVPLWRAPDDHSPPN
jgi:hypothetical protein